MKLLQVVPIAKGITKDQLSYFTLKDIPKGSIIKVPLRNKTISALVIDSEDAENVKAELRGSSFAVKKVASDEYVALLLPELIDTAHALASYFASSIGSVLHQIIPKVLLDNIEKLPKTHKEDGKINPATLSEKLTFQANEENRHSDYKSLVREEFARNKSVYIVTPTINETKRLAEFLDKGIENYVYTLHSELTQKEQLKRVSSIMEETHPILIIGSAMYLSVPRNEVGTIILERETARNYKWQSRPYIDQRIFARMYAESRGARFITADYPLSIESIWRSRQKEYEEFSGNRSRTESEAHQYIIDMRPDPESEDKKFYLLSDPVLTALKEVQEYKQQAFIFVARKGLAPSTVCEDCGSTVSCDQCGANVVLHQATRNNIFVCHTCGAHRSAKERCKTCNSWKLKALGVGSERIYTELQERFGGRKVLIIDSDHTKTYTQARKTAEQFYKTKGGILVGTELALSFVEPKVAVTAVASIDSLLSLPDPKMFEHIFSLLLRIRGRATDAFFIQTRQPELSVIEYAVSANIFAFYEKEILERRKFDYPPFSTLIKISVYGNPKDASALMEHVATSLKDYSFSIYPGFTPTKKGGYYLHGLLKIVSQTWPNRKLLRILRSLPPSVSINVVPESTL